MTTLDLVAMPVSERLILMERLWNSLCEKSGDDMVMPAWHEEVLAERLRLMESGVEITSSWSEAKGRVRDQAFRR